METWSVELGGEVWTLGGQGQRPARRRGKCASWAPEQ
jgi:hypothetical protein